MKILFLQRQTHSSSKLVWMRLLSWFVNLRPNIFSHYPFWNAGNTQSFFLEIWSSLLISNISENLTACVRKAKNNTLFAVVHTTISSWYLFRMCDLTIFTEGQYSFVLISDQFFCRKYALFLIFSPDKINDCHGYVYVETNGLFCISVDFEHWYSCFIHFKWYCPSAATKSVT